MVAVRSLRRTRRTVGAGAAYAGVAGGVSLLAAACGMPGAAPGAAHGGSGVPFEPIDVPRGPQALTAAPLTQGTMYSVMVFKSSDPAKERASVRAALGCLADEAQAELCRISLSLPVSQSALASKAYGQFLAQDRAMKKFADMSPSVDVRPCFPSVDMMFTIVGDAMTRICKRQDTITSALAEAERRTPILLDTDRAGKK